MGFEPTNIGFADQPLKPLGYSTRKLGAGIVPLSRHFIYKKGRCRLKLERDTGLEPVTSTWKDDVLPLH